MADGWSLDTKTILLVAALTGGTNALQALGFTLPAEKSKSEITANSEFIRDELNSCLTQLKECYGQLGNCQQGHSMGDPGYTDTEPEWELNAPYPEQFKK